MSKELVACGGCSAEIPEEEAEVCWYCHSYLCFSCWQRLGHCGHPEAETENRLAREARARGEHYDPHDADYHTAVLRQLHGIPDHERRRQKYS
jgi:hypothetical protein